MKHDTFKLWEFFRFSFKPETLSDTNAKASRNSIAQLLIDWKRKQFKKDGR